MSRAGEGQPTQPVHEPDAAELEALLARCAAGDRAGLETLYARVAPILLAVLLRMLKRRDAAEDALQDVFVSVWQRARQFDPIRGRPLAWLVSMARYRAIDLQRAARPAVALTELSALEAQLQSEEPLDGGEMLGTGALLLRCLEQIAAPQRRCLMLAYQEGLTHSEIARAVNEPLGTVKSWVRRSLLALRRCLES
ncbi:MAG TPA: sigma-70 family RNA polymerase sigma factor [Steroidobacteraceae bacterium]|jgi:RNA polymerase sigma-70 factor (ECF subfamily)|nr:sigma-70 family RNA polymerase sigma factor [Steroidobacteraceae bacterium]